MDVFFVVEDDCGNDCSCGCYYWVDSYCYGVKVKCEYKVYQVGDVEVMDVFKVLVVVYDGYCDYIG